MYQGIALLSIDNCGATVDGGSTVDGDITVNVGPTVGGGLTQDGTTIDGILL